MSSVKRLYVILCQTQRRVMSGFKWIEAGFIITRAGLLDKVTRIPWAVEDGLWSAEFIVEWCSIILEPLVFVWIINAKISFVDPW